MIGLTISFAASLNLAASSIIPLTREGLIVREFDWLTAAKVTTWSICLALSSRVPLSSLRASLLWSAFTYLLNEHEVSDGEAAGDANSATWKSSLWTATSSRLNSR